MKPQASILIVEDELVLALDLHHRLESMGYNVAGQAGTAEDAVVLTDQFLPSLVLMDIHLAGETDGIEAALTLRKNHDIPVVFLTAYGNRETIERAKAAQPYGYLLKPVDDEDLRVAIETALGKHEAERKNIEEQLQQAHQLMNYVVSHAQSAIAVHDRELKYVYVSQKYLRDYGLTESAIIGKHHYDVFPDLPQKWRDVHQRALTGEVSSSEEDSYPRADGTVAWARWECRPWYEKGGLIGGIIIYTEVITDRVKAREILMSQLEELQRWQHVMLDREDRVRELKREVNQLCHHLGQPIRYTSQIG